MISVTDLINSESPVGFAKYDIRWFTPRLKCDGKADGLRCLLFFARAQRKRGCSVQAENLECGIQMLSAEL